MEAYERQGRRAGVSDDLIFFFFFFGFVSKSVFYLLWFLAVDDVAAGEFLNVSDLIFLPSDFVFI